MNRGSTIFLRVAVLTIGGAILAICVLVLPIGIRAEDPDEYRPVLAGLYVPAIPFFYALYQTLKLLTYIDKNKAFSQLSVTALRKIKYCGLAISGCFIAGLPWIYRAAQSDDAPGVMLIGLIFAGASLVVAVFAAVLERLLRSAIAIKSENDLTV